MVESVITSFIGDKLIIEANPASIPKTGSPAFMGDGKVGSLVDVIGNIKKPYCVVKTMKNFSGTKKIIGEKIVFRRVK